MTTKIPHAPEDVAPPVVVDTAIELDKLVAELMQQPRVAVDTEANSFYAYHEQVCLIQISIPGKNYLVDPLALHDVSPLGEFFAAPEIEKVFHAADYDLIVLKRDFGFTCHHLFDTMWAARVLGWPKVGLADILNRLFDVRLNKRYQRYNWGRRPIEEEALTYAWMDSYYLLALRDIQKQELVELGRWQEAQEIFEYLTTTVELPDNGRDHYFWRLKFRHLRPYERRVLYQLYLWREETAEHLDRPSFKVLGNKHLVNLARAQPRNHNELVEAGLSHRQARRYGKGILQALRKQPPAELPPQPHSPRPPDDVIGRYKTLKQWRKEVAKRRGVDSDVILPNAVLWELAEEPPACIADLEDVVGIGPWRQATYGPDILELVA